VFLIIGVLLGYGFAQASSTNKTRITETGVYSPAYFLGSTNVTDILAYPHASASYIIWTENSSATPVYYAKNCTTGSLEFKGSDASTVIQKALNRLPPVGGGLYLQSGKYIIQSSIILNRSNVYIAGEGASTQLQLADGANCDIFQIDTSTQALSDIAIANLYLNGNGDQNTAGSGVSSTGGNTLFRLTISNVQFWSFAGDAVSLQKGHEGRILNCIFKFNTGSGINLHQSSDFTIDSCHFEGNDQEDIVLNYSSGNHLFNIWIFASSGPYAIHAYGSSDLTIDDVNIDFLPSSTGILLNNSYRPTLTNIHMEDIGKNGIILDESLHAKLSNIILKDIGKSANDTYYGIYIDDMDDADITNFAILSTESNQPKYGIAITYTCTGIHIINGMISNTATGAILDQGTHTTARNVEGYPTENWGYACLTGDGSTRVFNISVQHGLVDDNVTVSVSSTSPTSSPPSYIYGYLHDSNSDGFYETLILTVRFDTAPGNGEHFCLYWTARIVDH